MPPRELPAHVVPRHACGMEAIARPLPAHPPHLGEHWTICGSWEAAYEGKSRFSSGRCFRRTCLRAARSGSTWTCGNGTARWEPSPHGHVERQVVRRCDQHRFRCPAEKMDRRTHPRMDQPLSSARPRLRASRSQGGSVRPPRLEPPHAAPSRPKPLIKNQNCAEGLRDPSRFKGRLSMRIMGEGGHEPATLETVRFGSRRAGGRNQAVRARSSPKG